MSIELIYYGLRLIGFWFQLIHWTFRGTVVFRLSHQALKVSNQSLGKIISLFLTFGLTLIDGCLIKEACVYFRQLSLLEGYSGCYRLLGLVLRELWTLCLITLQYLP